MSDDLTFGVKLDGDSGSLVGEAKAGREELVALKKSTDDLAASSAKMASQYTGINDALKEHNAATAVTAGNVTKLLDRYDPLGAKLRQLQADFKALDQAASSGNVSARDDSRLDTVYQKLAEEIKAASGAASEFGKTSSGEMENVSFATHRAQQEMVVLGRELMSGNMSRVPGALSIIAQGLSGSLLAGLGAVTVAVAAGALAWESYGSNITKLREELHKLDADLGIKTTAELNKRYDELEKQAQQKRSEASSGGWGWLKAAEEAKVYEEEMRKVGRQIDANKQLEEKLGDAGGVASKLAAQAQTAKARDLEHQIELLQVYHDKQEKGSLNEIDSLSKIKEIKEQLAKIQMKDDGSAKILAEAKRMDEEMLASHEDAANRWVAKWQKSEDALIALGEKGVKAREQHELAFTKFIDAEVAKRAAAAKKEEAAKAKHLATLRASENAYFAQVAAAAAKDDNSATERENKRYQDDVVRWEKHKEEAMLRDDWSLQQETKFQEAMTNLIITHKRNESEIGKSYALQDIKTLGEKSQVMFEIAKQASVAEIIMAGGPRAEASAKWAATWGGPGAAAAAAALSWAATAVNVAKIEGTEFGGGAPTVSAGGGSVGMSSPSMTPSVPVSVQPPPTVGTAQTVQSFNITIQGAKDNPDKPLLSYNSLVTDFIPLLKQAKENGHLADVNVVMA